MGESSPSGQVIREKSLPKHKIYLSGWLHSSSLEPCIFDKFSTSWKFLWLGVPFTWNHFIQEERNVYFHETLALHWWEMEHNLKFNEFNNCWPVSSISHHDRTQSPNISPAHPKLSSCKSCWSIHYAWSHLSNVGPKGRFERTFVMWMKKFFSSTA